MYLMDAPVTTIRGRLDWLLVKSWNSSSRERTVLPAPHRMTAGDFAASDSGSKRAVGGERCLKFRVTHPKMRGKIFSSTKFFSVWGSVASLEGEIIRKAMIDIT